MCLKNNDNKNDVHNISINIFGHELMKGSLRQVSYQLVCIRTHWHNSVCILHFLYGIWHNDVSLF